MVRTTVFASALLVLITVIGCSDERPRLFTSGDAAAPDASGGACTSNAQCDDRVACTRDVCVVGGVCEHIPDGPMCMTTPRCMRAADCDDRVACTRDTCLVDGTCGHTPQNDMCSAGQTCDLTRGCSSSSTPGTCRADVDCRDAYDCTVDSCGVDGRCVYTAQNSRCAMGQVCRVGMGCLTERACSRDADCDDGMRCNGAERCAELACIAGNPANCDDMNACTTDACVETGASMCTHTMNPTCMGGAAPRSGVYTLNPRIMYSCCVSLGGRCIQEALAINVQTIQVTVTATGIVVTGAPASMLTGGPITGGMFSATGSVAGDCVETYTLSGRFTSDRAFTGTFSMAFVGLGCGLTDCSNQSFTVSGTLAI
ncbi:MAG: hypothetical protein U0324_08630 [Polyangiales bacterium]